MHIGILITSIGNFGKKGFYNMQEIGLAKELDKLFDEITVYKAVPMSIEKSISPIDDCEHATLYQIPVKSYGINGDWKCSLMYTNLDALIYFSDTQLVVPKVFKWCRSNNIPMYPYIGVIESHSTCQWKKAIIDFMFKRNLTVYKKCICFVKTPTVARQLAALGIEKSVVIPVGLDLSLLHSDYENYFSTEIKMKYGYSASDKILLFIGRLTEEKHPVKMIEIFSKIREKDLNYKLLMVGTGELKESVESRVKELNLIDSVQTLDSIPNCDIWELYCIAYSFVNLNRKEIFGMALLEAMYYGCKVVAYYAPGPNLIIENGKSGWLVQEDEEIIDKIMDETDISKEAHRRVIDEFTWENGAKKIYGIIEDVDSSGEI